MTSNRGMPHHAPRLLLTALVGASLFLVLGGPTPGSAGGCGEDSGFPTASEFCTDREVWECARMRARGDIDAAEEQACVNMIPMRCAGAMWNEGCQPTYLQTDACIAELQRSENLSVPVTDIPECRVCTGATGALTAEEP